MARLLSRLVLSTFLILVSVGSHAAQQSPLAPPHASNDSSISVELFVELEELARIVDISYCVGTAGLGIQKPFQCLSRCSEFENFELIKVRLSLKYSPRLEN